MVSFANSANERADLVVAADGVHSVVRSVVAANESRETGLSAFRFLILAEVLKGSEAANRLLEKKADGVTVYVDVPGLGGDKHIIWYARRGYVVPPSFFFFLPIVPGEKNG